MNRVPGVAYMSENSVTRKPRQANWDLLRALSMFLVVVVHSSAFFPQMLSGFNAGLAVGRAAIVCDPVFFMLSGYFALRPMRGSLERYYLRKLSTIVLPLVAYSIVLYLVTSWPSIGLGGYLSYTAGLLGGGWWFIPALIPMLILAPFIYQALEALSDEWIVRLTKLIAVLYAWGVVCHLVVFAATAIDRPGIVNLMTMLAYYVPTKIPGGYLPIFIFGYLFRRLGAILSEEQKRLAARIGIVAWVLCFLFAGLGVPEDDPNQIWVFAAFGTFFLFDRVRIADGIGQRLVTWAAKRSYTIYLLQYTTINLIHGIVYDQALLGDVSALPAAASVLVWVATVVAAYLLALLAASALDTLVLGPVQKLFDRLVTTRFSSQERRDVA